MRTSKARLHQLGCWRGWLFRNHSRGAKKLGVSGVIKWEDPFLGGIKLDTKLQLWQFWRDFPKKQFIVWVGYFLWPLFFKVGIWITNGFQVRNLPSKPSFSGEACEKLSWNLKANHFQMAKFQWDAGYQMVQWKMVGNHHFHPFKTDLFEL